MSDDSLAAESPPPPPLIERISGTIALVGGLLSLVVALVVVSSVTGRWLSGIAAARSIFPNFGPIPGDFELVQMATALTIFSFLPYCQARHGNIYVDTFTSWLPARINAALDAFWDLTYAGMAGLLGVCLTTGALEHFRNGQTTMLLQLIIWPALALCALLAFVLAIVALVSAVQRFGARP